MDKKKLLIFVLITATIIFACLYLREKLSFPVTYKVCGLGYVDCHTVARFDDRDSCETTHEKWGWYCDQTDKNNIICQEKKSDVSTGFCD